MKKLAILLIVISVFMSSCVVVPVPVRGGGGEYHGDHERGHDRDHDGVPNRDDRRPNDPHRY